MGKSKFYAAITERNIGILSKKQQDKLRKSCVAVLGLGGLGGVVAEILVRAGIGTIKILDKDSFEDNNINRQIFAFKSTLKQNKVDVTERFLRDMNPELKIEKYYKIEENNAEKMIGGSDAVVLALDDIKACIIIARIARKFGIPLIEAWALPYGNARVISNKTPQLEEIYSLPTLNKNLNQFSEEDFNKMKIKMIEDLSKSIKGIRKYYSLDSILKMKYKRLPLRSFAPMVWLTSVFMSLETVKVLLKWGKISYAPEFTLYDPFELRIP